MADRVVRPSLDGGLEGRIAVVNDQGCGSVSHTTAGVLVLDHPTVVSLLHEAGIDYRRVPLWERPRAFEYEETVRSEDPVRVDVTLTVEDRTLTVVLDGNLDVIEYRREDRKRRTKAVDPAATGRSACGST